MALRIVRSVCDSRSHPTAIHSDPEAMLQQTRNHRAEMSGTSLSLSNLRALVIVIVLAFHSMLAYLAFLPAEPFPFDRPPFEWQAFPIIDSRRFIVFDVFCAWQDVCLMSLMFFLSGLFVWPSLTRKQGWPYLGDRLLRIGLPLVVTVALLMPLAYYPSYRMSAADPGIAAYWREWQVLPFWPCGPQWFLWQLLGLNILAAALHMAWPRYGELLGRLTAPARKRPVRFLCGLMAASAVAYVPLALAVSPWTWMHLGPIGFQICRPLHYAVYFFAGVAVGAFGLERGLLAADGALARHWSRWLVAAAVAFGMWMGATALMMDHGDEAPLLLQAAAALAFVAACGSGCLFLTGLFVRFARVRRGFLDSLSESAYGMYLVHYLFVVWLQYALLGMSLLAVGKAAIVLGGTLLMSWGSTIAVCAVPTGARLIGAKR